MTAETLKFAELITKTIVELSTLGAIVYGVRQAFDYFTHRLDVTGKPIFEEQDDVK